MDRKSSSDVVGKAVTIEDTLNQGVVLYTEDGAVRKLPVPSSNLNDPLNFSPRRQRLILTVICVYGITGFGAVQSTPLFFGKLVPEYVQKTHGAFNPSRIADLASYPTLCMGLGNFFFVPLSMAIGRRAAFILSSIILLASMIWAARSESFESHLGARCLQGLCAGISDCLLPIIVLDISFLHKRSTRLVAYWVTTSVGSSLLLVAVPFIVEHTGGDWRVNYWFWVGFAGFSLLAIVLGVPETLFLRPPAQIAGQVHVTDSYSTHRAFATVDEAREAGFHVDDIGTPEGRQIERSYVRQFAPFQVQKAPLIRFLAAYKDIMMCLLIPGAFWALAFNSIVFGGLVVLSLTYGEALEEAPWHFSPSAIGTVQAGAAIGALLGLIVGEMTELMSRFLARRNYGVREPEHILFNFLFPAAMSFLGLVLYGLIGAHPEKYSWAGIHVAFGLYYFGFCAISALTGVWLGELIPHMSGPAIVLTCGGRNAVFFRLQP
ncbi:major facilitator superfamily domain-containing protein [Penicillium chermesinum]|uniref:Major facilitator superfamily domain-containing protein n=1 Tax=Penicillium chermesinum TaxID=63820 RepID=A0A9W9PKW1_9EURO|nr:major facilitator superfamily domain-containing protein [Penicillium chermesinum]KAJ5249285.1 major facilitator superfamily domain-containing protein [Penicillium chermesinum]